MTNLSNLAETLDAFVASKLAFPGDGHEIDHHPVDSLRKETLMGLHVGGLALDVDRYVFERAEFSTVEEYSFDNGKTRITCHSTAEVAMAYAMKLAAERRMQISAAVFAVAPSPETLAGAVTAAVAAE